MKNMQHLGLKKIHNSKVMLKVVSKGNLIKKNLQAATNS